MIIEIVNSEEKIDLLIPPLPPFDERVLDGLANRRQKSPANVPAAPCPPAKTIMY